MSCGVGYRRGSDLALLWLWRRPTAITPIRPLAWELPYALSVALEKTKKKKKKKKKLLFHRVTLEIMHTGVPIMAQQVKNLSSMHKGSIPGPDQWVKHPALLWLWCRPAATAPIRPLAWEPPYAVCVALKK